MKFDFVIGNPPYQEDVKNKGDRPNPVYDRFMDAAYCIGDCVELITPARFLFNAGQTPKVWNKKMLEDEHLKVLLYEPDASKIFSDTEIKGGVVITLRDKNKNFGEIGTFTPFGELNSIVKKITSCVDIKKRLNTIIASQGLYRFSEKFFSDYPEVVNIIGAGTGNKIVSSIIEKLPQVFVETPKKGKQYVRMLGRIRNQRAYRFIQRQYLENNEHIDSFNLFIPEANNNGQFGETLTEPTIGYPNDVTSDTFLSAGAFASEVEPHNLALYIKTKFFRALLGVKKVTQHCPPAVWSMIPLQDFTSESDIDWSKSIPEIDAQLYKKYKLTKEEIAFIESNVKEMP